ERRQEACEQVAVGEMELEEVEAGRIRHPSRTDEVVADRVHVATVHRLWHLAVREVRDGRRGDERPVARLERLVDPLPEAPRGSFPARVSQLEADLRRR